jgi:hypothetical protein
VQSLHRCRPPVLLHKKLRESRNKTLKITKGEREFRACWAVVFGRFLGVLILVPGRYLKRFVPGFSFLVFGSWALLVRALLVLGIAGPGRC